MAPRRSPTTSAGPPSSPQWSTDLPKPKNILMVSAHWEDAPTTLGTTTGAPLVYDFWGFPQKYYEVTYDAPAAPGLADDVTKLLTAPASEPSRRSTATITRPRPRRLRPAQGDVPRGRRAGAADVDADAGPARPLRDRPQARAAP